MGGEGKRGERGDEIKRGVICGNYGRGENGRGGMV